MVQQNTLHTEQLPLSDRLRQIEAVEFMALTAQSVVSAMKEGCTPEQITIFGEAFRPFIDSLSNIPCKDKVILNNVEMLHDAIICGHQECARSVVTYLVNRKSMFLDIFEFDTLYSETHEQIQNMLAEYELAQKH